MKLRIAAVAAIALTLTACGGGADHPDWFTAEEWETLQTEMCNGLAEIEANPMLDLEEWKDLYEAGLRGAFEQAGHPEDVDAAIALMDDCP